MLPKTRYNVVPSCVNSAETVNDGHFHTVELVTFNRMVNLSVDGGEPTTLDSQGGSQPAAGEAPLYVGGREASHLSADMNLWIHALEFDGIF